MNSKQIDSFYELLNLLNYETNFRLISFPFFLFFFWRIFTISYRKRQPGILSSRYICSGCHDRSLQYSRPSSASPSNRALRSRLADYLSYHNVVRCTIIPFIWDVLIEKKKKSFVKKKKKEKKTNRFLDSIYFKDLEWLFWRFLDAQENLPSHKSCSTIDARDIRRKCSWINHRSLHLRKKFFLKF